MTDITATEDAPSETAAPAASRFRWKRALAAAAALLVVAALAAFVGIEFRSHHQHDAVAQTRSEVPGIASEQAVAMLSYQHDTVDAQLADAAGGLTDRFRDTYTSLITQTVAPSAKEKAIDTSVTVVGTSIVDATGDSATLLLFLNQQTTSTDFPDPTTTGSRVRVELDKVDGRWLVDNLSPI